MLTNANLLATLAPALAAIRATNPTRAVVIGGENWTGIDSLATLDLPDDPNAYPTFHYYDTFAFTRQGAKIGRASCRARVGPYVYITVAHSTPTTNTEYTPP